MNSSVPWIAKSAIGVVGALVHSSAISMGIHSAIATANALSWPRDTVELIVHTCARSISAVGAVVPDTSVF